VKSSNAVLKTVRPEHAIKVNDTEYKLSYDFDAIASAEDLYDMPLITGLSQKDIERPKVKLIRALLYGMIKTNHPETTVEDVSKMLNRHNVADVWIAILTTIGESESRDEAEKGEGEAQGQ
jgi:hypothetical protein